MKLPVKEEQAHRHREQTCDGPEGEEWHSGGREGSGIEGELRPITYRTDKK